MALHGSLRGETRVNAIPNANKKLSYRWQTAWRV